jgi:choline dehydrogenase
VPDYVIVGAGSAGCVLANRLSADLTTTVSLVEAGGVDTLPAVHDPTAFMSLRGSPVDWAFVTEPQKHLNGRRIDLPQGKVLGGSSSINHMAYMRGNPADYAGWEAAGNTGWGWADMLACFRRLEDFPRGPTPFHGVGGPLRLCDQSPTRPADHPFIAAAADEGLVLLDDFFGDQQEGVSFLQLTVRDDVRQSTAVAYLSPVRQRRNLSVVTNAHVRRIEFDGTTASGVTYEQDGALHTLAARKEVILCAGAIGSPQLLMVSGVGPDAQLTSLGIDVVADLPGVGQNLHDHPACILAYTTAIAPDDWPGFVGAGAFLRTTPDINVPDLQLLYQPDPNTGIVAVYVIAVAPRSRGSLTVRSSNSRDAPAIDPCYLNDPRDGEVLSHGLATVRRLVAHAAFAPHGLTEVLPGCGVAEAHQVHSWISDHVASALHPVGTCAMGMGHGAVVDPLLRVRGVINLRVVDASIMPTIVNANTNAPVIAIAERAADFIAQQ